MKVEGLHSVVFVMMMMTMLSSPICEGDDLTANNDSQKTARMGFSWWDGSDTWLQEPPSPLGPPQPQLRLPQPPAPLPPQPPAPLPPQPPAPNHHGRPPDNLDGVHYQRGGAYAENIQCVRSGSLALLTAVVIPPSDFSATPVFEDAVSQLSGGDCSMRPNDDQSSRPGTFAMHVQQFSSCGVTVQQGSDGKEWVSVTLRFPFVNGLRMAEDEYVMIMCKPQERLVSSNFVFDIRGTASEGRSIQKKKVFRSGPKEMSCRMSLNTKPPGSQSFNNEIKPGSLLRLGQELQLKAEIRNGDGWKFAALRDVVISRSGKKSGGSSLRDEVQRIHSHFLHELQREHQVRFNHVDGNNYKDVETYRDERPDKSSGGAQLVFSNGCRNPAFRAVAPLHPVRDEGLVVTFNFKAFMFQDMLDGEALRLSAQVLACVEPDDCQHVVCPDQRNFRDRRSLKTNNRTFGAEHSKTENFTDSFELRIVMDSFAKTPVISASERVDRTPKLEVAEFGNCRQLLLSMSVAALLFCCITTAAAAVAIALHKKRLLRNKQQQQK